MFDLERIGIVAAACAALLAAGYVTGCSRERSANAAAVASAQAAASAVESSWKADVSSLRKDRDANFARIAAEYGRLLGELRNRPARLPEAARPACRGATGAELGAPDAAFLAGAAASDAERQSALRECYGWIRAVKGLPPLPADDGQDEDAAAP